MDSRTTISITEARKNIFRIADDIDKGSSYYTLTEHGKPRLVLMSADEFDSWQETLEVNREIPDLGKQIKQARKEYERGEFITLDKFLKDNPT